MKKIYLVFRNDDMTEGRGPMVLDSIYSSKEKAETYANAQDGVMGRLSGGDWTKNGNDWKVETWEVK
jgi:hypothetical protein